ncbi:MAG: NADH-quinone oxidoreductase subunit J [Proteobacteria bacterium]|nr:NADH-quinone oxidoreductase subunit J [Pseudomonadota bacterium]
MTVESVLFYAFAGLSLLSALAMVGFVRNVVAGAMSLVVTMISLAGIYVLLEAHLVAVIQIMVYAGAILVLFLFVIMLLNLRSDDFGPVRPWQGVLKVVGAAVALGIFVVLLGVLPDTLPEVAELPEGFGGFRVIGVSLFTDYVVPVEVAGFLLLAAIVGAVILAKRSID